MSNHKAKQANDKVDESKRKKREAIKNRQHAKELENKAGRRDVTAASSALAGQDGLGISVALHQKQKGSRYKKESDELEQKADKLDQETQELEAEAKKLNEEAKRKENLS